MYDVGLKFKERTARTEKTQKLTRILRQRKRHPLLLISPGGNGIIPYLTNNKIGIKS